MGQKIGFQTKKCLKSERLCSDFGHFQGNYFKAELLTEKVQNLDIQKLDLSKNWMLGSLVFGNKLDHYQIKLY